METIKKIAPWVLCAILIGIIFWRESDHSTSYDVLEKASQQREAILREEAQQLRLEREKDLKKIDSLEVDKIDLLREIQNIRKDEKEKLDKVDAYSTGELQQFFTDRYGK